MIERFPDCGRRITASPTHDGLEYGHQRGTESDSAERCPRRADRLDPDGPRTWQGEGGRS
jgi:hypothetical protein